jgi:hypothetical protein
MDKSTFISLIEQHQEQSDRIDRLSEIISYDSPVVEFGWKMFDKLMAVSFNENQLDWINWWLYERIGFIDGKEHPYYDEDNNAHYLHTAEDLWNFINKLTNE